MREVIKNITFLDSAFLDEYVHVCRCAVVIELSILRVLRRVHNICVSVALRPEVHRNDAEIELGSILASRCVASPF